MVRPAIGGQTVGSSRQTGFHLGAPDGCWPTLRHGPESIAPQQGPAPAVVQVRAIPAGSCPLPVSSFPLTANIPIIAGAAPFSLSEARTTALSVATFLWSGREGRQHDHSSEAQRRRILKRWHGRGDFIQELNIKALHTAIRIDYGRGMSVPEIAKDSIYSRPHIYRVVQAERAAAMAQRNDLIRDHIAGGARVSKVAALCGVSRSQIYRILKSVA